MNEGLSICLWLSQVDCLLKQIDNCRSADEPLAAQECITTLQMRSPNDAFVVMLSCIHHTQEPCSRTFYPRFYDGLISQYSCHLYLACHQSHYLYSCFVSFHPSSEVPYHFWFPQVHVSEEQALESLWTLREMVTAQSWIHPLLLLSLQYKGLSPFYQFRTSSLCCDLKSRQYLLNSTYRRLHL